MSSYPIFHSFSLTLLIFQLFISHSLSSSPLHLPHSLSPPPPPPRLFISHSLPLTSSFLLPPSLPLHLPHLFISPIDSTLNLRSNFVLPLVLLWWFVYERRNFFPFCSLIRFVDFAVCVIIRFVVFIFIFLLDLWVLNLGL
jgi:hypothetical protein